MLLVSIDLTDKGMLEFKRVLEALFAIIKVLQTEQPSKHVFDEYCSKGKLDWEFIQR